ncbi:hypothetical protein JM946_25295 [Steroidobacter sp. S1-65]|uniref:Uncharacterized protein n=1 Tax=Steroidobacter gossypii TaxID=2805490 RepID=A0ABS1X4C0_9GAMM|nr:hypothetical protein [Steroidobacter gossypii]MBM0108061.1 hypothetical protein [Steroidobacter gossypii]
MATRKRAKKKQSSKNKTARSKSAPAKSTRKKSTRKAAKRTLIAPKGDKRYVRRTSRGRFKESDDVSRSLSTDRRKRAKRKAPRGQGDKGD